jgi:PAS domain S-box-containing protein
VGSYTARGDALGLRGTARAYAHRMSESDIPPVPVEAFCTMVENVEDVAIFAMDLSGRIVHWNFGAVRILGYERAEILGQPLDRIFTPEDAAAGAPQQELREAAAMGRASDERWHVRKDGSIFWALGIVVPVKAKDGTHIGYGKFLRDRTDLKQLQETLLAQNQQLKQADDAKNHFLATLAHELRNPLSVMMTSAYLVHRRAKDDTLLLAETDRIKRQIRVAQRMVDDLADLARARRKGLIIENRRIDLRLVAREAAQSVFGPGESQQHTLEMFLTETPIEITGDPVRVHQIFVNLLTNAVRYTPAGGTIGVSVNSEGGDAVIRIKDTGVGIPPEKLATIFDLFTQAHMDLAESRAGLGIGLNLTRELVTLHKGTIQATSEGTGKGSEFVVRFPLVERQIPASPHPHEPEPESEPPRPIAAHGRGARA